MNSMLGSSRPLFSATLVALAALQGCVFDVDDDHDDAHAIGYYEGGLVVDWTVENTKDPLACDANFAAEIAIDLTSISGRPIETFYASCDAFRHTILLEEGEYAGFAVLLDDTDAEITTAVDLGGFDIIADRDTVIPINFPARSFR